MQDKSPLEITDKIFYEDNDFDLIKAQSLLSKTLENADFKFRVNMNNNIESLVELAISSFY